MIDPLSLMQAVAREYTDVLFAPPCDPNQATLRELYIADHFDEHEGCIIHVDGLPDEPVDSEEQDDPRGLLDD